MATPRPKRRAKRGERTVITIHGIRALGEWQERYEEVFGPHFHYESFKYPEFRHSIMGAVLLVLEWLALAVALASVAWAWRAGWLAANPVLWARAGLGALAMVFAASLIADWLRDRVVNDFMNFADAAVGSGMPPHVLAHSLGSFVLGRALRREGAFKT